MTDKIQTGTVPGPSAATESWLLFAEVGLPHGIKGAFFIHSPDRAGTPLEYRRLGVERQNPSPRIESHNVKQSYQSGGRSVVLLEGISSREEAEAIRGARLFFAREDVDLEPDEFLVADLVGTSVLDEAGTLLGQIHAVHDFGAQLNLEIIQPDSKTFLFPFLKAFIVEHDPINRRMVISHSAEFLD